MIVISLTFFLLTFYGIFLERVNRIPYKVSGRRKNRQVLDAIGIRTIKKQPVWHWLIAKQVISMFGFVCVYYRILGYKRKIYFEEYPILYTDLPYVMRKTIYKLYLLNRYPQLQKFIRIDQEQFMIQMDEVIDVCDEQYKELLQQIKERILELIEIEEENQF